MATQSKLPRIAYRKILYTTDLSESGRLAFPHAASLAHQYGAELTVFHVVESKEFEKFLVGYIDESVWESIKNRNLQEARDILVQRRREDTAIQDSVQQFCEDAMDPEHKPYVTYEVMIGMGDPVDRIVEQAHSGSYDLVVIGKHGQGVVHGGLMGDTARRVIRRCRVPVLVVQVPEKGGKD